MDNDFISVGKILNFHGIKGEAKIGFSKGREKQIELLSKVYVKKNNDRIELNVSSVRFHKHFAIIKFKEISTVNEIEELKGLDIYLPKDEVEKNLDNDEYLINDLIGLDVFDEDSCCIGQVTAIGENLASNILYIKDGNGKEHMVPFVKELVPVVDLTGRKIVINNIEGLIN